MTRSIYCHGNRDGLWHWSEKVRVRKERRMERRRRVKKEEKLEDKLQIRFGSKCKSLPSREEMLGLYDVCWR